MAHEGHIDEPANTGSRCATPSNANGTYFVRHYKLPRSIIGYRYDCYLRRFYASSRLSFLVFYLFSRCRGDGCNFAAALLHTTAPLRLNSFRINFVATCVSPVVFLVHRLLLEQFSLQVYFVLSNIVIVCCQILPSRLW